MKKNYPHIFKFLALPALLLLQLFVFTTGASAQVDAGVSNIQQPSGFVCPGPNDVIVVLHNYGTDTITSVNVNWLVNGNAQTMVVVNDTLAAGDADTITLGSFNFLSATTYRIKAYSDSPNGGADADNTNDTVNSANIFGHLTGTYTVGGTTPDFNRFPDAVAALNTYGVCGPVVINIRPVFDTMKVAINAINGASAVNTILIQSENGDSTSVVFSQASASLGNNDYLIRMNGADYVTLCRLTLQRTGVNSLQHVIDFTNSATHNYVVHSRILGGAPLGTSTQGALIYSSSLAATNDSLNTFTDNLIDGGSYGIYFNGTSVLALEANTVITWNVIRNQNMRGIHLNFERSPLIQNNVIESATTNTSYSGILLLRNQGDIFVSKNKVVTSHGTGLYLSNCTSSAISPGLITNNFLSAGDSAGIRLLASSYMNILNNSVLMKGTGLSGMFISGNGSGNLIENNIIENAGGGYCIDAGSFATSGVLLSDYNDLVTSGANIGFYGGTAVATLAAWITATGQDNNSVSIDPLYVSAGDLHATSQTLDNRGLPLGYVPDDIDGEVRNAVTPDIGADEFTGGSHDLSVVAFLSPGDSTCEDAASVLSVVISNIGGAAAGGFNVITDVSGFVNTTLSQPYAGSLQPGQTDTVTFATTLNTSGGGTLNFSTYTNYAFDDNSANDTLLTTLTIIPLPTVPSVTPAGVCGSGTVQLTAISTDTVQWYDAPIGGNLVATGNVFTTPFLTSTETFFVSAKGLCESSRIPVVASVFSLPVVNLGNDTIANDSVALDAGAGMFSYLWNTNDTTQTIYAFASGPYSVTVTDINGCTNADTVQVTILVGIPDRSVADAIVLYPNPASDHVTVDISGLHADAFTIRIVNMLGQTVISEDLHSHSSDIRKNVPLAGLSTGMYTLEVLSQSGSWNFHFLVR